MVVRKRSRNTRERILEEARDLFSTYGFEATTVRRIGAALGISDAAIYHHFSSKREIYEAALEALNERLLHALNDSGRLYLTQTRVRGRYVIRFAVGQRSTARDHVQAAWRLIQETARAL